MGMIGAMAQVTLNIVVSICCIGEDIPAPHTSEHYAFFRLEYSSLCGCFTTMKTIAQELVLPSKNYLELYTNRLLKDNENTV